MGFKPLTINTAADEPAHIYAQDDAVIFQSIFGADGVFTIGNQFKSTVLSNNIVRLSDGVLNVGGHIGRIEYSDYEDVTIENGAAGYFRNDIIYGKFLTNGDTDAFTIAVKKGTAVSSNPADPELIQGDVYQGAVERDYPLYRVRLEGLSIVAIDQLFELIPTIPELVQKNDELNNAIVDLSQDTQGQFVLKNGLKMCWGRQTTNNGVITFPIEFRSAPYVIGNFQNSNAELTMVSNILTVSATGFTYQGKYSKDFATWTTYYSGFVWFAIGY